MNSISSFSKISLLLFTIDSLRKRTHLHFLRWTKWGKDSVQLGLHVGKVLAHTDHETVGVAPPSVQLAHTLSWGSLVWDLTSEQNLVNFHEWESRKNTGNSNSPAHFWMNGWMCVYMYVCKYQTAFQSVGGENTLSIQALSTLPLSPSPVFPSPTVGNTMSQRMAHWHEWHGQLHTESWPDFVNLCSFWGTGAVDWTNFQSTPQLANRFTVYRHHIGGCYSLVRAVGSWSRARYWKIWRTDEW